MCKRRAVDSAMSLTKPSIAPILRASNSTVCVSASWRAVSFSNLSSIVIAFLLPPNRPDLGAEPLSAFLQDLRHEVLFGVGVQGAFEGRLVSALQLRHYGCDNLAA